MTVTLELTPEESARLEAQAQEKGIDIKTLLHNLIARMPEAERSSGRAAPRMISEEQKARIRAVKGKYAYVPTSSEEFAMRKSAPCGEIGALRECRSRCLCYD